MSVQVEVKGEGRFVEITAIDGVTRADYDRYVPVMRRLVNDEGKSRIILVLNDFDVLAAGAFWPDIQADRKTFNDVERFALVGDELWEKIIVIFLQPLTSSNLRYFAHSQIDEARAWMMEK